MKKNSNILNGGQFFEVAQNDTEFPSFPASSAVSKRFEHSKANKLHSKHQAVKPQDFLLIILPILPFGHFFKALLLMR